jgi:ubiquinone biosynthesis monooxygenase Coq7
VIRQFSFIDNAIAEFDKAITTVLGSPETTSRINPADEITTSDLTEQDKLLSARLMRINHAGEVSAQALYQGQALTAKLPHVRQAMNQAALEENDHLVWCQQRLDELDSQTSLLNPLWYSGSFIIGATAGKLGDKWSLGFVAETEKQVVKHLDSHLQQLSRHDEKSRAILEKMKQDELHHGTTALEAGGAALPWPIQTTMSLVSKVMTKTSYWL